MEKKKYACPECGDLFTEADWIKIAKEENGIDSFEGFTPDDYVNCPYCGGEVYIKDIVANFK